MEIERKFLIRELPPDLDEHPADRIAQGYLAVGDDGLEVRVRRRGGKAVLTVKQGSGLERVEEEVALGRARFERLWPLTEGRRIEKVRHVIPHGDLDVELDVYGGALAGLTVAEVEFASREDADAFVPPPWFGEEVTGDARFANRTLAVEGIPRELTAFELAPDESAAAGVWRITRGRFDRAIGRLETTGGDELGAAVHGARKDLKRLRAVVRLARDEVGDVTYRRENAALRDTGRRLSGARDSQVMVETLEALTERYADEVPPDAFSAFRAQLASEHAAAQRALRSGAGTLDSVRDDLRGARGRAATWAADLDGVQGLTTGFERIYRRGRKAAKLAVADRRDEPLHELRKRVKDLWYTAEVLRPAAPKKTKQLAKQASDLSDVIGEDHDLAVLSETAERHSDRLEPAERDLLAALIERRRSALQADALKAARRLYARKPKATARRIGLRR